MSIAAKIEARLSELGIEYDLIPHPRSGSTHESALQAHVDEGHIAKAVLLQDDAGLVMAVIPGDSWVRSDAVCQELNRRLELAPEAEIGALFPDCRAGAVPPLGRDYGLETCLDEALGALANVYFEAGDHEQLVRVSGEAFRRLLSGARHGRFSHE